jgi:putative acetyltransferase
VPSHDSNEIFLFYFFTEIISMEINYTTKRVSTDDKDFRQLVSLLDHELWVELKEDMETYDQFNKVDEIKTAVVVYDETSPVACGCFKEYEPQTIEIKRMFVQKKYRGRGISRMVLQNLEQWAIEKGYRFAVMETSIHFQTARHLYETGGYVIIPNYGPYAGLAESVCMKKNLA